MADFVYAPEKLPYELALERLNATRKMYNKNDMFSIAFIIREINTSLLYFQRVKLPKDQLAVVVESLEDYYKYAKGEDLYVTYLEDFRTLISSMRDYIEK